MKILQIQEILLHQVINYLAKQPYEQVAGMIQGLASLPEVQETKKMVAEEIKV
jgi:hypothetical protein